MRKLYLLLVFILAGAGVKASHQMPLLNVGWVVNANGTVSVTACSDPATNGNGLHYTIELEMVCYSGTGPIDWSCADTATSANVIITGPGGTGNIYAACGNNGQNPPYSFNNIQGCPGVTYAMRIRERIINTIPYGSANDQVFWSTPFIHTFAGTPPPFGMDTITVTQDTLCPGDTTTLFAKASGDCGIGDCVTYTWTPVNSLDDASAQSPVASPTVTTMYYVVATDECANQQVTDSILVTVLPRPAGDVKEQGTTANSLVLCEGDPFTLELVSNGSSFQWFQSVNGSAFVPIPGATGVTFSSIADSTRQYYVEIAGGASTCPGVSSKFTVSVIPDPTLVFTPPPIICIGDTANITVSGATTYTWSPPNAISSINNPSVSVYPTQTRYYYVDAENQFGCKSRDSILVTVNEKPVPYVSSNPATCPLTNGSLVVDSVGGGGSGYTYSINNGPFLSSPTFSNLGAGTYTVAVKDAAGCFGSTVEHVTELLDINASFTASPTSGYIPVEVSFVNTSTGTIAGYYWNFGNGGEGTEENPVYTYDTHGTYTVILTAFGSDTRCSDTAMIQIEAIGQSALEEPNVFTPNGDGKNDRFTLNAVNITELQLEIFDRWGRKVITITDPNAGWDGRRNGGAECSPGTYYYTYTAKGVDNYQHRGTGSIMLVR